MIRIYSQYISPKTILLVLLEGAFIAFGLLCGIRLRFVTDSEEFNSYIHAPDFLFQALTFVLTIQICFYYCDLYDLRVFRSRRDRLTCVGQSFGTAAFLLGLLYFVCPWLLIGRGVFFVSTAVVGMLVLSTRVAFDSAWRLAAPHERILILGTHGLALNTATELKRRGDLNVQVLGFLQSGNGAATPAGVSGDIPILGSMGDLERVVGEQHVSRIVVAMEDCRGALPIRDLVKLRVQGIRVEDAHTTVSALSGHVWLNMVRPSWFIFSDGFHRSKLTLVLKRIFDLIFGLLGLLLSSPLMALAAVAVRLDSKGPILFSQVRVGLRGRPFNVLKFRSMRVDAEAGIGAQWAAKNDSRVTRVGKYLRKYRIDELPQFINVIRGDMSFVGPRPERPVFVDQLREIISYYDERHSVRPGLTGLAQVQYPYGSTVEDAGRKLEYDLFYLKNLSIFFDIIILLKTIRTVLTGQGGR